MNELFKKMKWTSGIKIIRNKKPLCSSDLKKEVLYLLNFIYSFQKQVTII